MSAAAQLLRELIRQHDDPEISVTEIYTWIHQSQEAMRAAIEAESD